MKSVKDLRCENEIKPLQMASELGVALSTYFDKEAGRRSFKPQEIVYICKKFNMRVEDIENFALPNKIRETSKKNKTNNI